MSLADAISNFLNGYFSDVIDNGVSSGEYSGDYGYTEDYQPEVSNAVVNFVDTYYPSQSYTAESYEPVANSLQQESPSQYGIPSILTSNIENTHIPNDGSELSGYQQNFQNDQQQRLEQARDIERNNILASAGTDFNDPLLQSQLSSVDTMTEPSAYARDVQRRFTDENGNVELNPFNWNLLGFTSQQKSSDATNDLYDYWYNSQSNRNGEQERQPYLDWNASDQAKQATNWMYDDIANNLISNPDAANSMALGKLSTDWMNTPVERSMIDDGTSRESRESPYMTGEQYLRYRDEVGIPGRDTALINPDALYSKQSEMENYGFVPYVKTDEGLNRMHDDAAAQSVNNFFNGVADLRRTMAGDYTYNFEGNTYNGKDFDNRYVPWFTRMQKSNAEGQPFTDPSMVNENSVPLTWVLHDSVTGEDIPMQKEGYWDNENGKPVYRFGGDPNDDWYFDNEEDFKNSISYKPAGNTGVVMAWKDMEPLVLSDGQTIRADKAMELGSNKDSYADYGEGNWRKPQIEDPFQEGFLPWITDMALGSVPLFFGPTAAAQAMGNTWSNLQGFKPGYQGTNGEYKLLSGVDENDPQYGHRNLTGPTGAEKLISAAASASLPATERIWGSIAGKDAIARLPFWKTFSERFPMAASHPLTVWGSGALGEGLEEIPGNLVEEAQATGSFLNGDYFANPMYWDEEGNLTKNSILSNGEQAREAYDAQGNAIRDRDTNVADRFKNFFAEAPLSMLGGATLGGTLGVFDPQLRNSVLDYGRKKDELRDLGYNLVIPEEVKEYTRRQQEGE